MKIKTLYKDDEYVLQKVFVKIGDCKMIKYREIRYIKIGDDWGIEKVNEIKEPPVWYLRQLKLKKLEI
jgi:hypothetical protein